MASIKLTKYMRDGIRDRMLRHRFSEEVNALIETRAKLAWDFYRDGFTAEELRMINSLPSGWLPTRSSVYVNIGGRSVTIPFSGTLYGDAGVYKTVQVTTKHERFPADRTGSYLKSYQATDVLAVMHEKVDNQITDLTERVNLAKKQVEAALNSATTVGRLIELWPEVEPFTRHLQPTGPNTLPALPTQDLNRLLNLPVEEAA